MNLKDLAGKFAQFFNQPMQQPAQRLQPINWGQVANQVGQWANKPLPPSVPQYRGTVPNVAKAAVNMMPFNQSQSAQDIRRGPNSYTLDPRKINIPQLQAGAKQVLYNTDPRLGMAATGIPSLAQFIKTGLVGTGLSAATQLGLGEKKGQVFDPLNLGTAFLFSGALGGNGRVVTRPKGKANLIPPKGRMYQTVHDRGVIKMVEGEPVQIVDGVETFVHRSPNGWSVSEASTGRLIAESRSREGVVAKASVQISDAGADTLRRALERHRLTPPTKGGVNSDQGRGQNLAPLQSRVGPNTAPVSTNRVLPQTSTAKPTLIKPTKIVPLKVGFGQTPPPPVLPALKGRNSSSGGNYTPKNMGDIEQLLYGSKTPEKATLGGQKEGAGMISTPLRQSLGAISEFVGKGLENPNPVVRNIVGLLRGFAGGLGKSSTQISKKLEFQGNIGYGNKLATDVQKHVLELVGNDPKSLERIHAVLDPQVSKLRINTKALTAQEQEATEFLRATSDFINDTNYKNGFISKGLWQKNQGGKYIARAYEPFDFPPEVADFMKQNKAKFDLNPFKPRKEVDDWKVENAIKDPAYLMAKRIEQTVFNDSVKKMGDWMSTTNLVSDTPKEGFIQVSDHKSFGALAGKYIRKDAMEDIKGMFFTWDIGQKAYDVLNWYGRNPLRQGMKKMFTVYNPVVRLGNNIGNYVFAWMGGINPATFAKNRELFASQAVKNNNPLYRRMLKDGLLGADASKNDIVRMAQEIKQGVSDPNILKKIDSLVTKRYGNADDVSKLAAMKTWLDRGYSYEEASRRVYNSFQNYATVGFLYDIGANIPVLGNAFVRFQADLQRILKNAVVDHPVRAATTILGWKIMTDVMSAMSGETPGDRKTREERVGAPHIPFTGLSLEVQTPWGAVNASRMLGIAAYNPLEGPSVQTDISRLSPVKSPLQKQNYGSDPLIGPLVSLGLDTDFRGKSIKDPKADKYFGSSFTEGEQLGNQAEFLGRAYLPPTVKDLMDVSASLNGQEDYYGRVKTPAQAISKLVGVKIEQYGSTQAQKARSNNAYFGTQDKEFEKLSPDKKILYKQVYLTPEKEMDFATKYRKDVSDASTLLQNPELLTARQRVEKEQSLATGQPLNPFWNLTPEQQRIALTLKTFYPGDKTKSAMQTENIDWLKPYWTANSAYYDELKAKGILKADTRDSEEFFQTSPEMRTLLDQYYALPYGTGARSAMIRQHPELVDYWNEKREFTNNQRALLGLPPLEDSFSAWGNYAKKPKKVKIKLLSARSAKITVKKRKGTLKGLKLKKAPKFIAKKPKIGTIKLSHGTVKVFKPKPFKNTLTG